jgi:hypothetical protein
MKPIVLTLALCAAAFAQTSPFAGRWDMVVTTDKESYPDWMDLVMKDGAPQVRVQERTGSVHPVSNVKLDGSHLTLMVSRTKTWELTAQGGKISGTQKTGETVAQLAGVRAPELKRDAPKAWTSPEALFNGKDLTGWEPLGPGGNHWAAQDGVLVNETKGANLKTRRSFDDFKLHIELNCPDGGNSGIYLRGRYEIQVAYEKEPDNYHSMGAIYGFLAPSKEMPRKPGQWESFDATLVGRWLTLQRDGVTIIDHQEIPGITGGAIDANESEPGPCYFQGDHTGGMKYRNITVSVPKR